MPASKKSHLSSLSRPLKLNLLANYWFPHIKYPVLWSRRLSWDHLEVRSSWKQRHLRAISFLQEGLQHGEIARQVDIYRLRVRRSGTAWSDFFPLVKDQLLSENLDSSPCLFWPKEIESVSIFAFVATPTKLRIYLIVPSIYQSPPSRSHHPLMESFLALSGTARPCLYP